MGGWHHQLNAHEFEQTLGDSEGQGVLACCSPWGHKKSDTTERIDKYEGRYVEGKNICCVLLLSGLVFKRKPKKQKYSKVKKELEFPFPIRTINEIIPLRWFPARHFEMRAAAAAAAKSPMNCSMPGLPVYHWLPEFTQTHAHWVSDAIQPSHPLLSPSSPAPNPS